MEKESRKIIIMGASGHIGNRLVEEGLKRGFALTCIVRKSSAQKMSKFGKNIKIVVADPTEPGDWMDTFAEQDHFIHLIGVISEDRSRGLTFEKIQTETVRLGIEASKKGKVKWISHMSVASGIPGVDRRYVTTKRDAESLISQSGINYTIFRPGLVYGKGMLMSIANPLVILAKLATLPFPRYAPVNVDKLAKVLLICYQNPKATDKILTPPEIGKLAREIS